jgi:hypothetical protein
MRLTNFISPVTTSDWHDRELGQDNCTADSSSNFLGALDTEADMTIFVTDSDNSLESGTLTSTGLLLDGLDLQNFILEGWSNEVIDNFEFLDWDGVSDWLPFLRFGFTATSWTSTTTSSATAATTASAAESTAES